MYTSVKLLSTNPITKKEQDIPRMHHPDTFGCSQDFCQKQPNSQITTEKKNMGNLQESAYHTQMLHIWNMYLHLPSI